MVFASTHTLQRPERRFASPLLSSRVEDLDVTVNLAPVADSSRGIRIRPGRPPAPPSLDRNGQDNNIHWKHKNTMSAAVDILAVGDDQVSQKLIDRALHTADQDHLQVDTNSDIELP